MEQRGSAQGTIRRLLGTVAVLALAAAVGSGAAGAQAPEGNTVQPDAIVRKGNGTGAVGNNVYNKTGANQTKTRSVPAGTTLVYQFRIQNDSTTIRPLTPKGCASTTHFKVKYFLPQSPGPDLDVTPFVTAGAVSVPLGPNQDETYRVVVKVKRTAPRGATLTCRLKVTIDAKGPVDAVDVARLVIRRA